MVSESLRQEKLTFISELQSAKEKLHSCEALVARLGKRDRGGEDSQADVLDHQLNSLTQQVYKKFLSHGENKEFKVLFVWKINS